MKNQITLKQKRTWTRVASLLTLLFSFMAMNSIGQETIEFSEWFENPDDDPSECTAWQNFATQLTPDKNYLSVLFKGSENETGLLLDDPERATELAAAIHNVENIEFTANGQYWRTHSYDSGTSVWITASSEGTAHSPGDCPNGPEYFNLRACLENGNYGGISGPSCGSRPDQRIDLIFTYGGISLIENNPATCHESSDGSLIAEVDDDHPPFTFEWSNGVNTSGTSTTSQIEDLSPGEYTLTVTNNEGAEFTKTFTVGPDPIEVSFEMTQTSTCDLAGDGTAAANVTGGTAPYSYSWNSGEDTQAISNKSFGSYEVTVTDANNCEPVMASLEITADDDTAPLAQVQDIEVYLDANGQASIVADDIDNGSSDDCAITSLDIDVSEFTCDDVNAIPSFDGNTVLAFDGEDDYLEFDDVLPYSPNHTFAFWVRSSNNDTGSLFNWGGAGINNHTGIRVWSNRLRYQSSPGGNQNVNSTPFLNDHEWHHVVMVRNGNDVRIYVDGQLDATGQISNAVNNPIHVTLGAGFLNNVHQGHMDCELDEFAYWPEALNQQEIENMMCTRPQGAEVFIDFQTGTGTTSVADASENGNDATLHNMDASEDWIAFGEPKSLPSCPAGVKVQLSVTDAGGNIAQADAYVTVNDTISPIALARTGTLELNQNGQASALAEDFDDGSSDNCGVDGFALNNTEFSCEDLGINDIVLTVTDIHGNSRSVATQVQIEDNLAPSLEVQNVSVLLDEDGFASITTEDVEVASSDNCGVISKSLSIDEFSCEDLNQQVAVEMTVTDASGNEHSESLTVVVIDNIEPVADPQPYTFALDENGLLELESSEVAEFIGGDDQDNCGVAPESHALSQMQFTCEDLGLNNLTYSIQDYGNNTGSAPVEITIEDNLAPIALAQNITVELDEDGVASIEALDADNGSTDNCSIASRSLNITEFTCDDLGEVEVTMLVEDASGNQSQTSFIVEVVDEVGPSIPESLDHIVYLDENGEGVMNTSPLLNEASDACGLDAITSADGEMMDINGMAFSCENVGSITGPLLVRDVNGNTTEFSLNLTVMDTIRPSFELESIQLNLDEEGNASLTEEVLLPYASDNCGISQIIIENDLFTCEGANEAQSANISVIDANGNTKQHVLSVTLEDEIAPDVEVQDIVIALDEEGQALLDSEELNMAIIENCSVNQMILSQTQFSCDDLGSNVNSIVVSDAAGNEGLSEFNVTVIDNIAPIITRPDELTLCEGEEMHYRYFTAEDNCSASFQVVEGPLEGEYLDAGEYSIVLEAQDVAGNSSTYSFLVNVYPKPVVDLGADLEVEAGELITLVAGLSDEYAYYWNTGDNTSSISFVAVENENIAVEVVTPEGCRDADNIFIEVFTPLSTDEDGSGNAVSFFPNPTVGELNVSLSLNQNINDLNITVFDMTGKVVIQKMLPVAENGQVVNLNLSDLSDGVYLINVNSEVLNLTERVIKQ